MATPKHRISLSLSEIQHLIYLAANEAPLTSASISVLRVLQVAETKITSGVRVAAFAVLSPEEISKQKLGREQLGREKLGDSLGMVAAPATSSLPATSSPSSPTYHLNDTCYPTKEAYWEACYLVWFNVEDKSVLELDVVEAANEWRYLEDMMSAEESAEFETRETRGSK